MTAENNDHLERRCPRLGGPVFFGYCRRDAGEGTPCWKILDCWWEYFDVTACLSEAELNAVKTSTLKPKVSSILELIARAQHQ
jgi:hypothetical protein